MFSQPLNQQRRGSVAINGSNNNRRPCYIVGTAYDNLLWDESQNNGGYLSKEAYEAWPECNDSNMVQCNVNSSQESLYSEPAVRLTLNDAKSMAIANSPITDEHTGKKVGRVNNKWIENGKLMVEAHVTDLDAAEKARNGEYTGFSVGYYFDTILGQGGRRKVVNKTFNHLAICKDPVFGNCRFWVKASKTENQSSTSSPSAASGIRIDSVNDEPTKMQNNNSGDDKHRHERSFNDSIASRVLPMETQTQQGSFGGQGTNNVGGAGNDQLLPQQPQQQQQQQQQTQQPLQPHPSAPQFETEIKDRDRSSDGGEQRNTGVGLTDEEIKAFLMKKEKMRALKEENRAYKAKEEQNRQNYLRNQEPKKKAFIEHARAINGGELTEDIEEVIEGSYTTSGYEGWTGLLEKFASEHDRLRDTLEREREAKLNLERENAELKRKSEKQRNLFKYMRTETGERKKVSFQEDEGTETKKGLFKKQTPSGFSTAPHINGVKTPKIESIFRKQATQSQPPPQQQQQSQQQFPTHMSTGNRGSSTTTQHQGGFLDEARRHGVTASRGSFAATSQEPASSFGGFETREQGGVLNGLHPDLWDVFNKTSNVDPKADAFSYLIKTQQTEGIPVVRYPMGM